jgi:hypothetical protein
MPAGEISPLGRRRFRHELRTLTYVTLDESNAGVVRNLTRDGITVQAIVPVEPRQQMRVRFELRYPRLRVDASGEIVWSNFSGMCGIRFRNLPARVARQIDEWIFGNLLENVPLASDRGIIFPASGNMTWHDPAPRDTATAVQGNKPSDSNNRLQVIDSNEQMVVAKEIDSGPQASLDWLSQPLSPRGLAWTVNALVVSAAWLLFVLIFLSVAGEAPKWPIVITLAAALIVSGLYWGFFRMFGGSSLGERLARLAGATEKEADDARDRFR